MHKLIIELDILKEEARPIIELGAKSSEELNKRPDLKDKIERLSRIFYNKEICGTCKNKHLDALIALCAEKDYSHLTHILMNKCRFEVLPGTFLRDKISYNMGLNLTSSNITEEKALYHLATNYDEAIKYFTSLPENVSELIEETKNKLKLNSGDKEEKIISDAKEMANDILNEQPRKRGRKAVEKPDNSSSEEVITSDDQQEK